MSFQKWPYLVVCCVCLVAIPQSCFARRFPGGTGLNPYDVLCVPKDASQDDIRRSYRKMCLKYHPDKNVAKSDKERQRCEELFKRVQKANSQIGDEDSRRQYDSMSSHYQFGPGNQFNPAEEFFRSSFRARQSRQYSPFGFNEFDFSNVFNRGFGYPPSTTGENPFQSIYVQKVTVPLEDLYTGGKEVNLVLPNSEWQHYRAAMRGGLAYAIAFKAFGTCFPLLFRVRLPVFVLAFAGVFHAFLPRLTVLNYKVDLQRGWKGGTKLKFKEAGPGFVVIFELKEGKHDQFKRVGNDLMTTITIDRVQAQEGCTIQIDTMNELEVPITLELKPNQIRRSGDTVTIEGKGWPIRKSGKSSETSVVTDRGDLVVNVQLVRRRKRKTKPAIDTYWFCP